MLEFTVCDDCQHQAIETRFQNNILYYISQTSAVPCSNSSSSSSSNSSVLAQFPAGGEKGLTSNNTIKAMGIDLSISALAVFARLFSSLTAGEGSKERKRERERKNSCLCCHNSIIFFEYIHTYIHQQASNGQRTLLLLCLAHIWQKTRPLPLSLFGLRCG